MFQQQKGFVVFCREIALFENEMGGLGLQRAELEYTLRIVVQDEIDERIAKITYPIEDNDSLVPPPFVCC
jgi:hypothetical protein